MFEPARLFPLLAPPTTCPVCGGDGPRPLHVFRVNHRKPRVTRQLNLALVGCERCGVVFTHPFPSRDELDAYYGVDGVGWDERVARDDGVVEVKLERLRAGHALDLELVRRLVPLPDGGRALDFGCGIGGWLGALKAAGWQTYGIEPGPRAAAVAAREHVLLEAPPAEPTFDLVVVHHTLEHLRDPAAALRDLAAAARPGGALWVSVPNFELLGLHRDFVYVAGDRHIVSYTAASLRTLLAATGWDPVDDSNSTTWVPHPLKPPSPKRLVCVARRDEPAPPPRAPLDAALAALREYAATTPAPGPLPRRRLRRLVRRRAG